MVHRSLPYNATNEHRTTRAKWARGVAIVYGTILLLLAFGAAHRSLSEHSGTISVASDHALHPLRAAAKSSSDSP
jgi:hypothetical protein